MNAPSPTPTPSRFRQFSLRSLLVLILLCAVGLAWWNIYIEPYRRQRRLVEKIAELKGVATTETVPTFWSRVLGDDFFINIIAIQLPRAQINDAWMSNLRDAPRLRVLELTSTPVSDAGLAHIARLEHLQHLSLSGTKVTDAGVAHVQDLRKLESLRLNQTSITDEGLASLENLARLKLLHLQGCPIGDAGMAHLRGLTDLEVLDLRDTKITDDGVSRLAGLSKLARVLLDNTDVTEACLADLKKLPELTEVSVVGTHVIPSALREAFPAFDQRRLAKTLAQQTVIDCVEMPLNDVLLYLRDYHNTEFWLDRRSLREAGIDSDTPITTTTRKAQTSGIWTNTEGLDIALLEVLEPKGLKCIARTGVLAITTTENAGDLRPRLILKPGEKLSRKFSTRLYALMPLEFYQTPLESVLLYVSDYLRTEARLQGTFPPGFDRNRINHNTNIAASDGLELLFHELDVHGVIENNKIFIYPGPVPEERKEP